MSLYDKALLLLIKWLATLYSFVVALIFVFIISDLFFGIRWGYPRWSAFAVMAMFAIGLIVRNFAVAALKRV
jgi:hypothetical protein